MRLFISFAFLFIFILINIRPGRSGYPKISDRIFRVFKISGFEIFNPKFVQNKQNPTFRVPDISGSGLPEQPEMQL